VERVERVEREGGGGDDSVTLGSFPLWGFLTPHANPKGRHIVVAESQIFSFFGVFPKQTCKILLNYELTVQLQ